MGGIWYIWDKIRALNLSEVEDHGIKFRKQADSAESIDITEKGDT